MSRRSHESGPDVRLDEDLARRDLTVNAIAQAYMEFVPLFVFAGYPSQAEVDSGLLLHHQISDLDAQRRILAEVTCAQCRLDNPATAATELAQIMALAK